MSNRFKKCEKCMFKDRLVHPCIRCKGIPPTSCFECDYFDKTESRCSQQQYKGLNAIPCILFKFKGGISP